MAKEYELPTDIENTLDHYNTYEDHKSGKKAPTKDTKKSEEKKKRQAILFDVSDINLAFLTLKDCQPGFKRNQYINDLILTDAKKRLGLNKNASDEEIQSEINRLLDQIKALEI